ncbi:hypothetical protein [Corynebacterium pygosceleis]|uniref:Uncharacterized protein n=1 Tax=Corynebacterium pygosceleis TaxID=2800406 RepID=A0A9Q4GJZ4_9CORY|nr:hypothetical protein [Corynebacterium pygosceleis]MCK7636894.1 hypothetical protein [Corynebacterium pygosceleis]MCK7674368.1 hypothetical protein [Corynebacterium pygosceleis]MCL0120334.1 hypothetical protein [Corynebacterium pygosceleis]MCX7443881.1 hypothetical protein [Corynebacterium pygosceleis]MCX7467647.1 hypothetical protein [Corynebacterium pygosceleis]
MRPWVPLAVTHVAVATGAMRFARIRIIVVVVLCRARRWEPGQLRKRRGGQLNAARI